MKLTEEMIGFRRDVDRRQGRSGVRRRIDLVAAAVCARCRCGRRLRRLRRGNPASRSLRLIFATANRAREIASAPRASPSSREAAPGKTTMAIFETPGRGIARPADLRLRLSNRSVPVVETTAGRSGYRGAVRALHRQDGDGQRVQRAQRSASSSGSASSTSSLNARKGRPGSACHGRRLRPSARVRVAANSRRRDRCRSSRHAAHQQQIDSRRDPVSADEAESGTRNSEPGTLNLPFELQIAIRYLLARRRQAFISIISLVSTLGVTVGVMALIIALALMTGLQSELRDRILGSTAHIFVFKTTGIEDYQRGNRDAQEGAACHWRGAGDPRAGPRFVAKRRCLHQL